MQQSEQVKTWIEILNEYDAELDETLMGYINSVLPKESEIPRMYKELILVATSAAMRNANSLNAHAQAAFDHGASKKEIFEAISLAALSGGVPGLVEGLPVIENLK